MDDFSPSLALVSDGPAPVVDPNTVVVDANDSDDLNEILDRIDGASVHLLASGATCERAIAAAAALPHQVLSLVLVDCPGNALSDQPMSHLSDVHQPVLVLTAGMTDSDCIAASQAIAGRLPHGVFVIVDEASPPLHVTAPESFTAWAHSFLEIVDGLVALESTH